MRRSFPAFAALLILLAAHSAEALPNPNAPLLGVWIAPTVRIGGPANIIVTVFDNSGASVVTGYTGTIRFTIDSPMIADPATLPKDYTFVPEDAGQHTFVGELVVNESIKTDPSFASNKWTTLTVRVTDIADPTISQSTTVKVVHELAPLIYPDANARAVTGVPWRYNAMGGVTVDGAPPLSFSLCDSASTSSEVRIDAATGHVTWLSPALAQNVCVKVENDFGSDQYDVSVSVDAASGPGPQAILSAVPNPVQAGNQNVLLDARASSLGNSNAVPLRFAWQLGDGTATPPLEVSWGTYSYLAPGGWNAEVRVTDGFGQQSSDGVSIRVLDSHGQLPPVAKIEVLETPPGTFIFSCPGCSTDLGPLYYRWDFGDGQRSNEPAPTITYSPGRYHPTLVVGASNGLWGWDSVEIEVAGEGTVPPSCVAWGDPVSTAQLSAEEPTLFTSLRAAFAAGTAAITRVKWEIDGQTFDQSDVPFEFSAGVHEAKLRVEAADGQFCTSTVPIVAIPPSRSVPPLIVSEPPDPSQCGQAWTYRPISLGNGPISWKLQADAPNGIAIDETTGELSWMPDPRLGRTTFTITAVGDGAEYVQKVSLKAPCQTAALQTCGCGASGGFPAFAGSALLWLAVRLRRRGSRRNHP